jgi:hypothetical protein
VSFRDGAEVPPKQGRPELVEIEGGAAVGTIELGGYSAIAVGKSEGKDKVKEERRRGRERMGEVEEIGKREVKVGSKLLYGSVAARAVAGGGNVRGGSGVGSFEKIEWSKMNN